MTSPGSFLLGLSTAALLVLGTTSAAAQATSGTGQATKAATAASAPTDRMQRDAAQPLYWIKVLAEKPAVRPAAAAPAPVAAEPAPSPAAAIAANAAAARSATAAPAPRPARVAAATAAPAVESSSPGSSSHAGLDTSTEAMNTAAPGAEGAPAIGAAAGLAAPSLAGPALAAAEPPVAEEPDAGLVLMSAVDPSFPQAAMRRLRRGSVQVRFEVAPEGQVVETSIIKSTNKGLEEAAMDAVRQWRFKPAATGHAAAVELAFDMDK